MNIQEKYQRSVDAGFSDDQIIDYLSKSPEFSKKFESSREAGYSDQDVLSFIKGSQPQQKFEKPKQEDQRSIPEKAARVVGQYGLGIAQTAALPYEIAVAPLASKQAQLGAYRSGLSDDLERLLDQKVTGVWDEQDEDLLQNIIEQIKDPKKSEQYIQTADLSVQGLAEKATGLDLEPEGFLEKAARWTGWVKNPKNLMNLAKSGVSKTELAKAILPGKTEAFRGAAAGSALQAAEDGEFGPVGTMAAAIAADVAAGGAAGLVKAGIKAVKNPKQQLAKAAASFTKSEKQQLQKTIIKDFSDAGIQADLGTITDSNLIRWVQSRLAQSGLTGPGLEKLRTQITTDIKKEYGQIAEGLGNSRFQAKYEAGQATKDMIVRVRDKDLQSIRDIYKSSEKELKQGSKVFTDGVINKITDIEKSLTPGSVKSAEQKSVLKAINELKQDLLKVHPEGRAGFVQDLINNKRGIQDIINYETQGGAKQLLKGVNAELDRAIISHGRTNPKFAQEYVTAQKRFSTHAKTFRNKNIDQIIKSQDPSRIIDKMNSAQGIRDVRQALKTYPAGEALFNNLKRFKFDEVIGSNLVDSVTKQAKLGTFSKLLEKGKNREIIKELLSPTEYRRLQKLQTNAGRLADSANKFFNSSQSATVAADAAAILTLLKQVGYAVSGNPWPIAKGIAGAATTRKLSSLIADPEFLKLTEEAIRAFNSKQPQKIQLVMDKLSPYALEALGKSKDKEES